jgi:Uma2 family endonuclease
LALSHHLPLVSPEAYLDAERAASERHEYIDGAVIAMSGGSRDHSRIKVDLTTLLSAQMGSRDCEVFDSDLRVRVDPGRYTYPDLSVVCGESRFADDQADTLLNPTVIVEVLSPATEAHDRGEKWSRYRQMPSLQAYVLVSQDRPLIEVFARTGDVWIFADARGLDGVIELEAIGVRLALREAYARVAFGGASIEGEADQLRPG